MRNIVMIGAQGSGKGTQADRLAQKLKLPVVHLGQALREEVSRNTGLGRDMEQYISKGVLVPIDMVGSVMSSRLSEPDVEDGVIMDGFPRTLEQAQILDEVMTKLGRHVTNVIYLDISNEVAMKRLSGRRVCSNPHCEATFHVDFRPSQQPGVCDKCGRTTEQRSDDIPEVIEKRLQTYHEQTSPVIGFYEQRGILKRFDADRSVEDIEKDINEYIAVN